MRRIAHSGENDWRRFLLAECVEAYAELDEAQRLRLETLLTTEPFREVRPLMMTTYERGKLEGKLEERRETALLQLETKFGPLTDEIKRRVAELSAAQLRQLTLDLITAQTLPELQLLTASPHDATAG